MAREQVAGAIILDRLRERIVSGIYFGLWRPGERLPSIREIAEAEGVDRKTAAAAYRRLEREGLVRVHPRSGVYLRVQRSTEAATPLEKLYRRWLENTYARASALGLRTNTILRLVTSVAEIERLRVPVVEQDWPQAETIAAELRERAGINSFAVPLNCINREDGVWAEAPFIVTTPYCRAALAAIEGNKPIVEATLAAETVRELKECMRQGDLTVVVANNSMAERLRPFLQRTRDNGSNGITIATADDPAHLTNDTRRARMVFVWPGTPQWAEESIAARTPVRPLHCLSEETLARVRGAILDAAVARERDAIWRESAGDAGNAQQQNGPALQTTGAISFPAATTSTVS